MVPGARLESLCTVKGTVGSNPTLSAITADSRRTTFNLTFIKSNTGARGAQMKGESYVCTEKKKKMAMLS